MAADTETKPKRASKAATAKVAKAYFAAIDAHDPDAAAALWAPDGVDVLHGQREMHGPAEIREFVAELCGAIPDVHFEIHDATAEADRCALRYTLRGTFAGPGTWNGIAPTGNKIAIPGIDVIVVDGDKIVRNDAYVDGMTVGRQLGLLPPQDSPAEQRMTQLFNARTRAAEKLSGRDFGQVAEGVWRLQGQPARCNVYFVADGDGVLMFDAGARTMTKAAGAAAALLGGLTRIVLGHGHTDHRGTAPGLDAPVYCHPDEVVDAEGSGGFRYWDPELRFLSFPHRQVQRYMHRKFWDGGPVKIEGTVAEGDDVAGFKVVHLPGHAPGQIALFRESDRLALTTDVFYTLDTWGRDCDPHVPFDGYNFDTEQARASIRKLAALEPAACWPGHANALVGADLRSRLERAADSPA